MFVLGRAARLATVVFAIGVGGGVAYLTRPVRSVRAGARPTTVERAVKALDRLSTTTRDELSAALSTAGAPSNYASPWREELELGTLVLAGDRAAIEVFAAAKPPTPARARAWLRLALDGSGADARAMLDRLRATYPASAAARVYGARTSGRPK